MSRREWTPEDVEELLRLEKEGYSRQEIAERTNRSFHSIESKSNKLHIKMYGKQGPENANTLWTQDMLDELVQKVKEGKTVDELSEYFHRSRTAITVKVNRLGLKIQTINRTWTKQEDAEFSEDWLDGSVSIYMMCKKYNRNFFGLRKRAQVLKLGPRPYNDYYLDVHTICEEMNVSNDRVYHWIKMGLKTRKNRSGRTTYLIDSDDLLEFLEQHQDMFDASLVSEYIFLEEPQWLIDKREVDKQATNKNEKIPYTNEEDKIIQSMFRRGKPDDEIALKLKRTATAIKTRRGILGLSKVSYQDYEIDILREYSDKLTVYELNKKLPLRRVKGIMYKCKQLGLPYHVSKAKCKKD